MSRWAHSAVVVSITCLASCNLILGNEEGTLDPDLASGGKNTTGSGGSHAGRGGTSSKGGSSSKAGSGSGAEAGDTGTSGTGNVPVGASTKLGAACTKKADCSDPDAPGLICITPTQTLLGGGAPPNGLCTAPCDPTELDSCAAFGNALCRAFDVNEPEVGYCVEGCTFGAPVGDEVKCHGRAEFACNPALTNDDGVTCSTNFDCNDDETCLGGVCTLVTGACLPTCGGDPDCAPGMYCDQAFLSGVCVETPPIGLPLGAPCTVQDEPDDCIGTCQRDASGSNAGHCATNCAFGSPCGYNSDTGLYDGYCLTISTIRNANESGDFALCTPACGCTDECYDVDLTCQVPISELDPSTYSKPGLCLDPLLGLDEIYVCGGDGA
jgi:hypothetical protein